MRNSIVNIILLSFIFLWSCNEEEVAPNSTEDEILEARSCASTHDLVGASSALAESDVYGISGDVTILSDCEIEISNFFYNGLGPNVRIYGALDGAFSEGFSISETLSGRAWEGETLNLFLPEGVTFDEVNSFSVWCFEFEVDFGSVHF